MNDPFGAHTYRDTVYWLNGGSDVIEDHHRRLWLAAYRMEQVSQQSRQSPSTPAPKPPA